MTHCKDCNKRFNNNPIKAWGREVTPVRCSECRSSKNSFRKFLIKQDQNRSRWLSEHFKSEAHSNEIMCTYGDA